MLIAEGSPFYFFLRHCTFFRIVGTRVLLGLLLFSVSPVVAVKPLIRVLSRLQVSNAYSDIHVELSNSASLLPGKIATHNAFVQLPGLNH